MTVVLLAGACGGETVPPAPTEEALIDAAREYIDAAYRGDWDVAYGYLTVQCRSGYSREDFEAESSEAMSRLAEFNSLDADQASRRVAGDIKVGTFNTTLARVAPEILLDGDIYLIMDLVVIQMTFDVEGWRAATCGPINNL